MPVTITAASTTLDFPAQLRRLIDRAPSGRLWAAVHAAGSTTTTLWYSDNNGGTWAAATGTVTSSFGTPILFVDIDGGLNLINTAASGFVYRRGTVSGSTITWGATLAFSSNHSVHDLVVFRNPLGSGWTGFVAARSGDVDNPHSLYRLNIPADGTAATVGGFWNLTNQTQGGSGFNGGLDFYHTGDSKTTQGGTPHVYIAFSDSFNTLWVSRFVWTGTGHLNTDRYFVASNVFGVWPVFDGTRLMMLSYGNANGSVRLWERDAGNTATIERGESPALANGINNPPSISFDRDGNIYVYVRQASSLDMYYIKWTRATLTWGTWQLVTAANSTAGSSLRIGYAYAGFPTIEGVHADGGNIVYQQVLLINAVPFAPTLTNPINGSVGDVNASLGIAWTFNDQDLGDAQTAYSIRRRRDTVFEYWNGSAWVGLESGSTKIVTGSTSVSIPAIWGFDSDKDHYYSVKTWDALSQVSPWSAEARVTPSVKDNPAISVPASNGASVASPSFDVSWTVATQTKYRIRVIDDAGGSPNPGIVDYDSGIVSSTTARTHTASFPVNSETRQIELTTWNDEGLQSNTVYRIVNVSYTPPSTPSVALSTSAVPGAIRGTITNPGGGATKSHNDVYRRVVGDTSAGIRIARDVPISGTFTDYAVASGVPYQYLIRTFATTGATAQSAWTT